MTQTMRQFLEALAAERGGGVQGLSNRKNNLKHV